MVFHLSLITVLLMEIYEVLKKCRTGIAEFPDYKKKKPKLQQQNLFELSYCKDLLVS